MIKYLTMTIFTIFFTSQIKAQDNGEKVFVWAGLKSDPYYKALSAQRTVLTRTGSASAKDNEIQIRAASQKGYIEVKNKNTLDWLAAALLG